MWLFLYFTCVTQLTSVTGLDCACGVPSGDVVAMRIVGGRRTQPHAYPWTTAILKNDMMHCGGAIITNRHVLSAGHCFKWDDINDMSVYFGIHDLRDRYYGESRNISEVIIHENFTSNVVRDENDIAIATLNRPVTFSEYVIPICLPEPEQSFADRVAAVVGWGRLGVAGPSSNVLMKATIRIQSDDNCMASRLGIYIVPRVMMCAYSKGRDGCQGDSGGPLITFETSGKYVLAGVVSWGIGCADPRYPGVYTKVSSFNDWIMEHAADGAMCDN